MTRRAQPTKAEIGETPCQTAHAQSGTATESAHFKHKDNSDLIDPNFTQLPQSQNFPMIPQILIKKPQRSIWTLPQREGGGTGAPGNIEDIAVLPVRSGIREDVPRWEPIDGSLLKDLLDAVEKRGLGSLYFKQLLRGLFRSHEMIPYDCKYIAIAIFTDSQHMLWNKKWREALQELRDKYARGPYAHITVAQMAGDIPYHKPESQMTDLPPEVLRDIIEAAEKTLLQIQPSGPSEGIYTEIRQSPSEPFTTFVDRLTQAIDRQVMDENVKPHLLQGLAFANANAECRRIISALPGYPAIEEMIEACTNTLIAKAIALPPHANTPIKIKTRERTASVNEYIEVRATWVKQISRDRPALTTLKLTWKTDDPIWVDQWPLEKEKLSALEELVQEQLQKGHITPTTSPWNSPVFVIRKKSSGSWRLIHDLRRINEVIEEMGPLQLGLPSLSVIPRHWPIMIFDLKDCFFNIPLHPKDAPRFAFSVPSINRMKTLQRYHWVVLPQGLRNSPTICQWFVARTLSPVREKHPKALIIHYMDDLLITAATKQELEKTRDSMFMEIRKAGLEISTSKIQEISPWSYLGWKITAQEIRPQKIQVRTQVNNLQELQRLLGEINWVRTTLGITNEELSPFLNLLKGDTNLRAPRTLTPEAQRALENITEALQKRQAHRVSRTLPSFLGVLGEGIQLYGLIFQWDNSERDPLLIIEWVFLPYRFPKTIYTALEMAAQIIIKARTRLLTMTGKDFTTIYLSLKKDYLDWALQKSDDLQIALLNFTGVCSSHFPSHKLLQSKISYKEKPKLSEVPLNAITLFTDGSGKTHKAVITWQNTTTKKWESDIQIVQGSPQIIELAAVVRAFQLFQEPFNLITDLAYVANIVKRTEGSLLKEVDNENLYCYLISMQQLIGQRENPYFVSHIRAHSSLPGFLAEGNARADKLTLIISNTLPNIFEQAKLSHTFFHQNAQALMHTFHISKEQGKAIINACPDCQLAQPPVSTGAVNPRGLESLQLWQVDVTKYPSFGRFKNIHVSVDTFSGAVFASLHTGETAKHACRHFLQAFASLGVPKEIKTDNGPTYKNHTLEEFLKKRGVYHITGIPHSSTSQAIIERTHRTLKSVLDRQKRGEAEATIE
ncbi:PREDICTED: endogenous retrovirus group K member 18 Pol protein-like [Pseudopodoces humilis]|uniref:endogenous retrovirus group K member 18 Pol protein-like n=1 Tax=Pseudopodoces humilis TaxID=181119 RepID=UPI0006B85E27|nr:PREDICTED: endogenous retrovirus group K member 18 Pol protein-like [Pseudopodoces humilis]